MQEKWAEEKQKLVKVHHASTPKISTLISSQQNTQLFIASKKHRVCFVGCRASHACLRTCLASNSPDSQFLAKSLSVERFNSSTATRSMAETDCRRSNSLVSPSTASHEEYSKLPTCGLLCLLSARLYRRIYFVSR
jgi:hypothetical protein